MNRMSPRFPPGAQITVRDGQTATLAVGQLYGGEAEVAFEGGSTQGLAKYCKFDFKVDDVPGTGFYNFEVAGKHVSTLTRHDIEDAKWDVHLAMNPRG